MATPSSSSESIVQIDSWFGRFSNNLIQLVNAVWIAKTLGYKRVYYPDSSFFRGNSITVCLGCSITGALSDRFFTFADVEKYVEHRPTYEQMQKVAQDYILSVLESPLFRMVEACDEKYEKILHIRGGDIFSRRPQPRYVPPPTSYFEYHTQNSFCGVIYEDRRHPAVKSILKKDNCFDYTSGNMFADIFRLGHGDTIVVGPGTFWFSGFLLVGKNKKIILSVPQFADGTFHDVWRFDGWPTGVQIEKNFLVDYVHAGGWRNSFWQRRKIKTYDFLGNALASSSPDKMVRI